MTISSDAWPLTTRASEVGNGMRVLQLGPGLDVRGGVSSVERLIANHTAADVEITHIATMEDGSLWRKVHVFASALWRVRQSLRRPEPLIVHIHFSSRGSTLRKMILAWMTLRARQPLILHAHGSVFDSFFDGLPAFARATVRRIFSRADRLIVLSSQWKQYYVSRFDVPEDRVVVLCNPAALPPSVPDRTKRPDVRFLFLGRIGKRKGAFDLVKAFAGLPEPLRTRARLVFAGDGEVDALRSQASPLDTQVHVHSWIDIQQRDALLEQSDVFVLPSYNEGVPMALLEAMAHGLPVITTPVGGIPDAVTDGVDGVMVEPGNIKQLTHALQRMIESESLRVTLGRNARARAERCDVKQYSAQLAALYRSLLSARSIQ